MGGGARSRKADGVRFGSYASMFGEPRWRKAALLGMLLALLASFACGASDFSPELVGDVIAKILKAQNVPLQQVPGKRLMWTGVNMIVQNAGAFFGMIAFTKLAQVYGTQTGFLPLPLFARSLPLSVYSKFLSQPWHIFVFVPIMGFCQLSLFAASRSTCPSYPHPFAQHRHELLLQRRPVYCRERPFTLGVFAMKLAQGAVTTDAKLEASATPAAG